MRAGRLVRLLLLLQARGRMTAAQLASELEVSERTIYRDILDLSVSGVPVLGERGDGGGYGLMDGYRTHLTGLTAEEASALLLAGAPGPAAELGLGSLLAATRLKLLAAVPAGLRDVATRAEQRFLLDPTGWAHARKLDRSCLREVSRAVWEDRQLDVTYLPARGEAARRVVHPLALVHKTGSWYLIGIDRDRPLVFRVDRLRDARVLEATAQRPADFELTEFWRHWEQSYAAVLPRFLVTVRLGPDAQRYRDAFGAASPREVRDEAVEADGWARQTLLFDDVRVAVALLLALAPQVEVIAPEEVRQALLDTTGELTARLSQSSEADLLAGPQ